LKRIDIWLQLFVIKYAVIIVCLILAVLPAGLCLFIITASVLVMLVRPESRAAIFIRRYIFKCE